jgi:hypothetical protein
MNNKKLRGQFLYSSHGAHRNYLELQKGEAMTNRLKIQIYAFFVLSILAAACSAPAASPQHPEEMLKPGDKIAEMTLRPINDESEQIPALMNYCDMLLAEVSEEKTVECTVAFGPHYFLSSGLAESHPDNLDSEWQKLTWQMSINGIPVDLEAFGTVDGTINREYFRQWDILLDNPSSGPYEIYTRVTTNDDPPESYAMTLILNVAE